MSFLIEKDISSKVLMAGNYYKKHHPGGISAVVDYWSNYVEKLQYYPTFKESNFIAKRFCFFWSYLRLFFRMLLDSDAKIVHLHTAADGSFWRKVQLIKLAKLMNRKVVLHVHASRFKDFYNESSGKKKEWIAKYLKSADVLICLSKSWKAWFEGVGVDSHKIVVLHNITAYPEFSADKVPCENRKIHFLFMGEIGARKGVFDILRGLAKHRDEIKDEIVLRIGGNKMESELICFIRDNGLSDFVHFEGWVGGEKKIELLNWADVFVLPSFNEGLPISILEAMSYKMPIISTAVGGIPEVVENGVNGVIVTPGAEEEIYRAMRQYVDNKSLIEKDGRESYLKSREYMPDFVLNSLKKIYETVLI